MKTGLTEGSYIQVTSGLRLEPAGHRPGQPVVMTAPGPGTPPYGTAPSVDPARTRRRAVARPARAGVGLARLRGGGRGLRAARRLAPDPPRRSSCRSWARRARGSRPCSACSASSTCRRGDDPGRRAGRRARSTTPPAPRLRGDSIGFVFQQFHLIPHLTALGNVETALLYRDIRPKERRERCSGRAGPARAGRPGRPPARADVGRGAATGGTGPSHRHRPAHDPGRRADRRTRLGQRRPRARDLRQPGVPRAGRRHGDARPHGGQHGAPEDLHAGRPDRGRRAAGGPPREPASRPARGGVVRAAGPEGPDRS